MDKCKQCGKPVTSVAGRKKKEFCDVNCRNKHFYAERKKLVASATEIIETAQPEIKETVHLTNGVATEFMGHPIPDGLSGVPLMVWKNDIKKKFKDAKKLPK